MDKLEKNVYRVYKKKVKYWSYFTISISCYILLNVCIGFSSAPFYEKEIPCFIQDPTPDCDQLAGKASMLYAVDMITGLILLYQAMVGLIFIDRDNIKKMSLAKLLRKSCKYTLIVYVLMLFIRIYFFFVVHSALSQILNNNGEEHINKGFGSFFAEYIDNVGASNIVTIIILCIFILFYASNFWMIA